MRTLVIGGIEIPMQASYQLTQSYDPDQAVNRFRTMDGTLKQMVAYSGKLITTISGGGQMPAGIQAIDYLLPVTIKCIAEEDIQIPGGLRVVDIPTARRADYGVEGKALLNGVWVSTAVSMAGDTATLTAVVDATQYKAIYWPELVCYLDPPSRTRDNRKADYGWSITAAQI